jgi:hypothetical protein
MRTTYTVAALFVTLAWVVAFKFLPARAVTAPAPPYADAEGPGPDSPTLEGLELGIENIVR